MLKHVYLIIYTYFFLNDNKGSSELYRTHCVKLLFILYGVSPLTSWLFLFLTSDFNICLSILKRSTVFVIGARNSNCKQQVCISNAYKLSHMCRLQNKLKNQYKNRKTKLTVNFKNS